MLVESESDGRRLLKMTRFSKLRVLFRPTKDDDDDSEDRMYFLHLNKMSFLELSAMLELLSSISKQRAVLYHPAGDPEKQEPKP